MTYELWSKASRTVLAAYETEAAALAAVRSVVDVHGEAEAAQLAIIRENSRGRSTLLAEGQALVDRALRRGTGVSRKSVRAPAH